MSAEPSPRPWTFCPTYGEHRPNSIIVDADGGNVSLVCYFANEEEENRIGNLIVNAVNERDRLRLALKNLRDASRNFYHEILNSQYSKILDKYTCVEQGFPSVLALNAAVPDANIVLTESDDSDMARAAIKEEKA